MTALGRRPVLCCIFSLVVVATCADRGLTKAAPVVDRAPRRALAGSAPSGRYVVLIIIDAGNPAYLKLGALPHIHALISNGTVYDRAWVGQLASNTAAVHVTFGTGTLPKENGFPSFQWVLPGSRNKQDFRALVSNGAIDSMLRSLPYSGITARLHNAAPDAVSVAVSSTKDYAAVAVGAGTADYELYGTISGGYIAPAFRHTPPPLTASERALLKQKMPFPLTHKDSWAFDYALAAARHLRPAVLMINLPEVDTEGHWVGPQNSRIMSKLMKNIDRGIGRIESLYQSLGILNQTDFIITADHSMIESRPAPSTSLVGTVARKSRIPVSLFGTADGAIWLHDPRQAGAFAAALVRARLPHVSAIFYRTRPGSDYTFRRASPLRWLMGNNVSAAYRYLADTTAGKNGPDLWLMYREHYTPKSQNVSGLWKGTHGGASWQAEHIPLVLSGPGIRAGLHTNFPARAVDIAPTVERLLGIAPLLGSGTVLSDALSDPDSQDIARQKVLEPSLARHVEALATQSRRDG